MVIYFSQIKEFLSSVNPEGALSISERFYPNLFCSHSEKPAIYEIKDGQPNLINFELQNGVYIVPKIVDTGYLAIGKKKLAFFRHQ